MTVKVVHPFVSAIPDGADTSVVRPSDWNADHTITGLATVAETGVYSDLTGLPTLGTAAATAITDYATAAQGAKADTALQNAAAFDAAGAAAAAAAASLPLHSTADDSAKVGGTTPTTYGKSLIDDVDAAAARTTLALGTLATQSGTFSGTSSGTNTGDDATNAQYSGLAASKQDTLVSATNIKTINGSSVLGSGDLVVSGALPELIQMSKIPVDDADITADYSAIIFRQYTIADGKTLTLRSGSDFAIL